MEENKPQDLDEVATSTRAESKGTPKCYRVRLFRSKGAALVLFWNFIIWGTGTPLFTSLQSLQKEMVTLHGDKIDDGYVYVVFPILAILWLVSAIVNGWLGDIRFRRYKVIQTSAIIMWIGHILLLLVNLVLLYVETKLPFTRLAIFIAVLGYTLTFCSGAAFLVNTLQLGLDQLLLASTDEVVSYIYWYVLSSSAGSLVSGLLQPIVYHCSHSTAEMYLGICMLKLVSLLGVSIILCSIFLFGHWLSIEPPSPNPFTQMIQVVAYARQHNHPEQRSALTYWEEKIPTKLDLGKDKYGGPFTTEQVEDVKTCLRMIIILSSLSVYLVSFFMSRFGLGMSPYSRSNEISFCLQIVIQCLTYDKQTVVICVVLLHELVLHPLASKWLPNTLKRFGIAGFLSILLGITLQIPDIVGHHILHDTVPCMFSNATAPQLNNHTTDFMWITVLGNIQSGLIIFFTSSGFVFVISQAPHNTRGFFIGYFWSVYATAVLFADINLLVWDRAWQKAYTTVSCGSIYFGVAAVIGVIGFVVYCIVAKRYKYRQRQDDLNMRALIESVYSRYVEHNSVNAAEDNALVVCID